MRNSVNEFSENSYTNYYLIRHGIEWIILRSHDFETFESERKLFESQIDLESANNLIGFTSDLNEDNISRLNFYIGLSSIQGQDPKNINENYIKPLLEKWKENIYVDGNHTVNLDALELAYLALQHYVIKVNEAAGKINDLGKERAILSKGL